MVLAAPAAWGQTKTGAAEDKKPAPVLGSYSLVTTALEPAARAHWLTPPLTIAVEGGKERSPAETEGTKAIPAQMTIEGFATPRSVCRAAGESAAAAGASPGSTAGMAAGTAPRKNGCDALDRTDLTIEDATTVAYDIVNRGPPVEVEVNLEVHDVLPVSHGGASTEWRAGDVIFVRVPKGTTAYPVLSEVLVGDWHGEAVVFEVGKDLPAAAKKALDDLGVHQDLGDSVLYSFRVREPEKQK